MTFKALSDSMNVCSPTSGAAPVLEAWLGRGPRAHSPADQRSDQMVAVIQTGLVTRGATEWGAAFCAWAEATLQQPQPMPSCEAPLHTLSGTLCLRNRPGTPRHRLPPPQTLTSPPAHSIQVDRTNSHRGHAQALPRPTGPAEGNSGTAATHRGLRKDARGTVALQGAASGSACSPPHRTRCPQGSQQKERTCKHDHKPILKFRSQRMACLCPPPQVSVPHKPARTLPWESQQPLAHSILGEGPFLAKGKGAAYTAERGLIRDLPPTPQHPCSPDSQQIKSKC